MKRELDDEVDARGVSPRAASASRWPYNRSPARVCASASSATAPERRDHLNVVNGRLHYLQAIRRVKARSHVVDAAQSDRDGFGEALLIERRLERSAGGGEGEECGDNDDPCAP